MELEALGNVGYQVGALGIVAVTFVYLTIVRWWTDLLGRVLAAVLVSISLVLAMSTLRMLHVDLPGNFFAWRAAVFWGFGVAVWSGLSVMVWAQFFAPRLKHRSKHDRLTTPTRRGHEQAHLADSRHGDYGGLHDRAGGPDR